MVIKHVQILGATPLINGQVMSGYIKPGANGIAHVRLNGDSVDVITDRGDLVRLPISILAITFDAAHTGDRKPTPLAPEPAATKKRGRPPKASGVQRHRESDT